MAGQLLPVPLFGQDDVMSPPDVAILDHRCGCTVESLWVGQVERRTLHTAPVEAPHTLLTLGCHRVQDSRSPEGCECVPSHGVRQRTPHPLHSDAVRQSVLSSTLQGNRVRQGIRGTTEDHLLNCPPSANQLPCTEIRGHPSNSE